MEDRRRVMRLKDENDIVVTIMSSGEKHFKERVFYNQSKDISALGTGIMTNIFLPVNTFVNIDMTLTIVHQIINVLGKVKWISVIFDDESFAAGVEFFNAPPDAIKKLTDYIWWKQSYYSNPPI